MHAQALKSVREHVEGEHKVYTTGIIIPVPYTTIYLLLQVVDLT